MLLLYQIVHMVLIRTNYLKENIGFECDSLILIVSRQTYRQLKCFEAERDVFQFIIHII